MTLLLTILIVLACQLTVAGVTAAYVWRRTGNPFDGKDATSWPNHAGEFRDTPDRSDKGVSVAVIRRFILSMQRGKEARL